MRKSTIVVAVVGLGVAGFSAASAQPENANARPDHGQPQDMPPRVVAQMGRADDAATGGSLDGRLDPGKVRVTGGAAISQNRAEIAKLLMASSDPHRIAIDANVGAPLPGDVDVQPLPSAVADLVPEYRGFEYATANDRIVIIEPSTRRIVQIIIKTGGPS